MSGSTASISGIISGLDTSTIISEMVSIAQQPENQLQTQVSTLQTQLSAWQSFNTQLLALQTSASAISSPVSFNANTVTSSDQNVITGTADSTATAGTYYVTVSNTAQSEQLSSQGFANTTDAIGTGNVNISFANGKSFSVTLNSNTDTLAGLCDAINNANGGVNAEIVNTGNQSDPYQLLLTSKQTGTAYAMTVDTSGLSGGTAPVINQVVQAASDANLQLGTGSGQISITKSSNTIDDVIPGITLNLASADKNQTVTLQVQPDTSTMEQSIQSFVTQYNSVADYINQQFTYTPPGASSSTSSTTTTTEPPLFGSFDLQTVQNQLVTALNAKAPGLTGSVQSLADVGIGWNQSGELTLNTGQLQQALQSNPDAVSALFSTGFTSSSPDISYVSNTASTQPSPTAGYTVDVTQTAAESSITAGVAQSAPLVQSEVLTLNSSTIVLQQGWSQQQVIDAINKDTQYTGVTASATGADGTGTGNYLTLTQTGYGSDNHVQVQSDVSSSAGGTGLGTTPVTETSPAGESDSGTGVVGRVMIGTINGVQATSDGQYLTAQAGTNGANTANGLELKITATAPFSATVNFTKGVAAQAADALSQATGVSGSVNTAEKSVNSQISDLNKQITNWNTYISNYQNQITTEFNNMETALGKLESQGEAITQLLGSLYNNSSSSSGSSKSSNSSGSSGSGSSNSG